MKKITRFNKELEKLKADVIGQIKVELLVYRKFNTGKYKFEESGLYIFSDFGNEEVDRVFINWDNDFAEIALATEFSVFKLEEMRVDDLIRFYGLIQDKELEIKAV